MARGVTSGPAQPVILFNPNGQLVETLNDTLVTFDTVHARVHEGKMFQSSFKAPDASPIADDAAIEILISVGVNTPHLVFRCDMGGNAELVFFEGTTVSSSGTPLSRNNVNRTSGTLSVTKTFHTPTITLAGSTLHNSFQQGGTGGNAQGGGEFGFGGWFLAKATLYLVRCINRAGNPQPGSITLQWIEL